MTFSRITGTGSYLPAKVLTNRDLELAVDTSDEWIVSRTGIHQRYIAGEDETTASLATTAALRALECAHLSPAEVELIIVSTSSPEHAFPATACLVQDRIGAVKAGAFDLSAACSGL
jgi:3-oxoacyl-[acyl-carrier-protein] synthase-3